MPTHDADHHADNPAARRTMTRDPNAPGGPIVETEETKRGNHVTAAGSTHLTANIDGEWFVVNSRGEKILQTPFPTESAAVAEAQKRNPQPDEQKNL